MNSTPTLLVLAAGMATRYGKLKQIDQFGPSGESILDYSVYDAIRAGFKKVIFVVRESIKEDFLNSIAGKFDSKINVEVVCQELSILPEGYSLPQERTKPWGTGHAVWVASEKIDAPFAVINADDFYGLDAFKLIADFLRNDNDGKSCAIVGYKLSNTLSEHGYVSRGICEVTSAGYLAGIEEHTRIAENNKLIESHQADETISLTGNEVVSMNLMGFKSGALKYFESYFKDFLNENGNTLKSEFYLPSVVNNLISKEIASAKVLNTNSDWFGVTYPDDKKTATLKIKHLIECGAYPKNLWK